MDLRALATAAEDLGDMATFGRGIRDGIDGGRGGGGGIDIDGGGIDDGGGGGGGGIDGGEPKVDCGEGVSTPAVGGGFGGDGVSTPAVGGQPAAALDGRSGVRSGGGDSCASGGDSFRLACSWCCSQER